jgi:hypothetical protein
LDEFIGSIADAGVRKYLLENRSAIVQIYEQSGSGNLRVLKYALWDFERFAAGFGRKVWDNAEATRWLLEVTLALAIEYRLGHVTHTEIVELFANKMMRDIAKYQRQKSGGEQATSRIQTLEDRYPALSFDQTIYDGRVLADGLKRGWFDPSATEDGFSNSSLFVQPSEMPAWRTVWSVFNVSDEEFNSAVQVMEKQFAAREFHEPGEILHVAGLRLFLSEAEVFELTKDKVVAQCKAYIDDQERTGRFSENFEEHFEGMPASYGLGFVNSDTAEFREVRNYLKAALTRSYDKTLPEKAAVLLEELRSHPEKFIAQISSAGNDNTYWNVPVLIHIAPGKFADALLSLQPSDQRRVMLGVKDRYDHQALSSSLADEEPWLKQLAEELNNRADKASGIARWRLKKYIEWTAAPFGSN